MEAELGLWEDLRLAMRGAADGQAELCAAALANYVFAHDYPAAPNVQRRWPRRFVGRWAPCWRRACRSC